MRDQTDFINEMEHDTIMTANSLDGKILTAHTDLIDGSTRCRESGVISYFRNKIKKTTQNKALAILESDIREIKNEDRDVTNLSIINVNKPPLNIKENIFKNDTRQTKKDVVYNNTLSDVINNIKRNDLQWLNLESKARKSDIILHRNKKGNQEKFNLQKSTTKRVELDAEEIVNRKEEAEEDTSAVYMLPQE